MKGADAFVSVADLVFNALRSDGCLQSQLADVDLFASQFSIFLLSACGEAEWPAIRPADAVLSERCGELADVLLELLTQLLKVGDDL